MTGFITTQAIIDALNVQLLAAFEQRGIAPYLFLSGSPLITGGVFLSCSDGDLDNLCYGTSRLRDFPETTAMIETLGGLDARVDVTQDQLVQPSAP